MKNLLTLFLIPLLITILGNNSRFQYGDNKEVVTINSSAKDQEKEFKLEREIKIVQNDFAYKKQVWYVRAIGVLIIFLPFIYFPFKNHYEKKFNRLHILDKALSTTIINNMIKQNMYEEIKLRFYWAYGIYIVGYNVLVIILALLFGISVCLYSLLVYERFLNFIAWLI